MFAHLHFCLFFVGTARIMIVAITNRVPIRSGVVKLTFIQTAVNTMDATGSTQETRLAFTEPIIFTPVRYIENPAIVPKRIIKATAANVSLSKIT